MDELKFLDRLASVAQLHVQQQLPEHAPLSIESIDAVLAEIGSWQLPSEEVQKIVDCYAAWLGGQLVARGGNWIGLGEPVPPRVEISGRYYCPVDAVARQLHSMVSPDQVGERTEKNRLCILFKRALEDAVLSTKAGLVSLPVQAAMNRTQADEINRVAWNSRVTDRRFAWPKAESFEPVEATAAQRQLDPWLRQVELKGRRVLCLAAGGGLHAPMFACAGAMVTVVDIAEELLAIDQAIARKHALPIDTIRASMTELTMLEPNRFDLVVQPVSSCYIADIGTMYREVARVLIPGGLFLSQHKSPASVQSVAAAHEGTYRILLPPAKGVALPAAADAGPHRDEGTVEFCHSLDALIGGLCRNGFVLEDFEEPARADHWAPLGSAGHRAAYIPPYIKLKARRKS